MALPKFGKIFAVIGTAYAAALAIAMKKRKDEGTSKLDADTKKSTLENVVDEIAEIHKNAYKDVRAFVVDNFSDVKDFDTFKNRVTDLSKNFAKMAEEKFEDIKDSTEDNIENVKKFIEENYEKAKTSLKNAEEKVKDFADDKKQDAEKLIADAKKDIEEKYETAKKKISK